MAQLMMFKALRGVKAPMAPSSSMSPAPAVKLRMLFPLIVLEKVILPPPVESDVVPIKPTRLAKESDVPSVVMVPDRLTLPPPLCEKAPLIEVPAPATRVSGPELTMATGPKAVVTMLPLIDSICPVRAIPPMAFVLRPLVIEVVAAAVCVIEAAAILEAETLFALVIVKAPNRVDPPTFPVKKRLPPDPKFKVKFCPPSTVLEKVMLLPVAEVSKLVSAVKVTGAANEIGLLTVVVL